MKIETHCLIFSISAALWDGTRQLEGSLELWETEFVFRQNDFKEIHLNLRIPLSTIEKVEDYVVFNLVKNGLRILNKDGKSDLFVIDDVSKFKKILIEVIAN